jgi:hypothetical protein
MENFNHDCLFVTVDAGKISNSDKMFQLFYPFWYKLRRLPFKLMMKCKMVRWKILAFKMTIKCKMAGLKSLDRVIKSN